MGKNSAQIASNACYFATQQAKEATGLIHRVAEVACRKIQSFARGIIARRELTEILEMTQKHDVVEILFKRGMRVRGEFFLVAVSARGHTLRIRVVNSATGAIHVVAPGYKEFILFGLLSDKSAEAQEISKPIIFNVLNAYFETQAKAVLLISKNISVGRLNMFVTATTVEGTTTVVAMETQSSKTHTYRIADGNQDAPALSYGADGKAYLTDGDIIAYLATKLSLFYTGIKRSNSTIAAEIALKKAHQRIEQVLNPAPIDYTFKEVKVNSDLPVMVAL